MIYKCNTFEKELDELCKDMSEHVKCLRDYTYHPYDKEEQFVYRLREIINKHFKDCD